MSWVTKLGSGRGSGALWTHCNVGSSGTRAVPVPLSVQSDRSVLNIAITVDPARPVAFRDAGAGACHVLARPMPAGPVWFRGPAKHGFQIVYELCLESESNLAVFCADSGLPAVPKRGDFDPCIAASLRHPGRSRSGRFRWDIASDSIVWGEQVASVFPGIPPERLATG